MSDRCEEEFSARVVLTFEQRVHVSLLDEQMRRSRMLREKLDRDLASIYLIPSLVAPCVFDELQYMYLELIKYLLMVKIKR